MKGYEKVGGGTYEVHRKKKTSWPVVIGFVLMVIIAISLAG